MRIVLTGPKGSGKTTVGEKTARLLGIPFIETDQQIEALHEKETGKKLTCREIYRSRGADYFRALEIRAIETLENRHWCLISTGGSSLLDSRSFACLRRESLLILLKAPDDLLWERIQDGGLPPFLEGPDGFAVMGERNRRLYESLEHRADIIFDISSAPEEELHRNLAGQISGWLALGSSSPNTFGDILRVTTFGESHGEGLGAILDGIPAGVELSAEDIQKDLDRRRPGQSSVTTPRNEKDRVKILSGIFEGKTTGTPLCMVVFNEDQDSSKYENLRRLFRPGHADFTFWKKYGIRDHRGGGRSSGRETIGRVSAGAVAKKILAAEGVSITAFSEEIAGIRGSSENFDEIEKNPVRAADPVAAKKMENAIIAARKENDSVGGIVRLVVKGLPPGLGDPVFGKLDAKLASAIFSLGAVKGLEFGTGFAAAAMKGSGHNDPMKNGSFLSNNAGGILGGISTGQDLVARIAIKPTPSIFRNQETITTEGKNTTVAIEGRHDPCIVPRIIPVIESMAALVILDLLRMQKSSGNPCTTGPKGED